MGSKLGKWVKIWQYTWGGGSNKRYIWPKKDMGVIFKSYRKLQVIFIQVKLINVPQRSGNGIVLFLLWSAKMWTPLSTHLSHLDPIQPRFLQRDDHYLWYNMSPSCQSDPPPPIHVILIIFNFASALLSSCMKSKHTFQQPSFRIWHQGTSI